MGFQVAAVVPSPCARSSASSAPSTSSRSPFLGGGSARLAKSWAPANSGGGLTARRRGSEARPAGCALSASIDGMGGGDTEFLRRIEELAASAGVRTAGCGWPPSLERSASSVGLPLSLRMLKRKKQQVAPQSRWDERLLLGSAGDSVGRAFSSMVLIVRELQSFALQQMQAAMLCGDDLQAVLARAHGEMHDSFVWLFQHIFAGTPALMISLMLLLANFTVHSMSHSMVAAAAIPPTSATAVSASVVADAEPSNSLFDSASVKTLSIGRTASVGGGSGGGGDARPVAGAPGDDRWDESRYSLSRVAPQQLGPLAGTGVEKFVPDAAAAEDEQAIWESMVAEASSIHADARAEELTDPDVLGNLVAPVVAEMETEDVAKYARTERSYELAVSQEPNNSLILANFAQFLYLTRHDHKRAEHYFERAVQVEPTDAEALSRYATFLWKARDDVDAAEETYQEAIAADPGNSHYAAAYAHFLWNTGGDDTCYPLD
uniref:Uncharacterized protein n=1 Tax=Avena sativa TaxID=4498 RepID=A0ACD5U2K3_AVESA